MLSKFLCSSGSNASAATFPKALFNNSSALNKGMSLSYSRPFAISTLAQGSVAAIDQPAYDDLQVIAGAPEPITMLTDGIALTIPFSGYWSDGRVCDVIYQQKSAPNPAYVNIYIGVTPAAGAYDTLPARSVNIRCANVGNKTTNQVDLLKGTPDETANRVHSPIGFTIVGGEIFALCAYSDYSGSWQTQGLSLCRWNEANTRWALLYATRAVNVGAARGREWVTSQYWPLDGLPVLQSLEVFLAFTDYQTNPGGTGGQLLITRLSRAVASDPWTIGQPVLLFEESGITPNCHFHNAFVMRSGTNGIQIGLSRGDSSQSELIGFYRADSSTYDQGWSSGVGAPTASATDGATLNGWTTVRKIAGCPTSAGSNPAVGWNQAVGFAALPGETRKFVMGNDEGQNCNPIMTFPDLAAGETKATFDLANNPIVPPWHRRGRVNLGMWCDPSARDLFLSVAYINSGGNTSTGAKNEKQRLTFVDSGGSGTFTLTIGSDTTSAITYSATAATLIANVTAALQALPGYGAGTITVTQFTGTQYDVQFTGAKGSQDIAQMSANGAGLTNVTVSTSTMLPGSGNTIPSSWSGGTSYLQGFSAAVGAANCRVVASRDGINWFILAAPNAQVRPSVRPDGWALFGGITSYGKVTAYKFPNISSSQPMRISPGTTNYLISTLTQASGPTANNTWASVDPVTQLGVASGLVTGRTIPKPPCNGPIRRWTVNGASSKFGGDYLVTTGNPVPAAPTYANVKVRLWVYMLPTSNPYGGDNVAPYNSPRCGFRLQLLRSGSGAASFAAAGDVDSMDGSGWVPIIMTTNTKEWADYVSAAVNLAIRFTDNGSGATNMDVLIAFDLVQITTGTDDLCTHPAPVAATASTMGHDVATINNIPISTGADWTALFVTRIPKGGWDQYTPIAHRPTNPRFWTLYQDVSSYIYARADVVNRRLIIGDNSGTVSIAPPAGEEFVFEAGCDLLIALSCSGTTLNISASVGGTQVATGTLTLGAAVAPTQLIQADNSIAPIAALNWIRFEVDPTVARDATARKTALKKLKL